MVANLKAAAIFVAREMCDGPIAKILLRVSSSVCQISCLYRKKHNSFKKGTYLLDYSPSLTYIHTSIFTWYSVCNSFIDRIFFRSAKNFGNYGQPLRCLHFRAFSSWSCSYTLCTDGHFEPAPSHLHVHVYSIIVRVTT